MSKMVAYKVKLPKGVVTKDQVMQVLKAMGLKPKLLKTPKEVPSYTGQDSATGNLSIETDVLGGWVRQKEGIGQIDFDPQTGVVRSLELFIDSWGIGDKTDRFVDQVGRASEALARAVTVVAEASKPVEMMIPGVTLAEFTFATTEIGGRLAPASMLQAKGSGVNLGKNYLEIQAERRLATTQALGPGSKVTVSPQEAAGNLLQVGKKPKIFSVDLGDSKLQVGYVPPVAKLEEVPGGVKVTLPSVFLTPTLQQSFNNARNLGLALKAIDTQTHQHAVAGDPPVAKLEVAAGKIVGFSIDWSKPETRSAKELEMAHRIAEREAAQNGKIQLSSPAEASASINLAALKQSVVDQAHKGKVQFVTA